MAIMKLKLGLNTNPSTPAPSQPEPSPVQTPASSSAPRIKIKLPGSGAATPSSAVSTRAPSFLAGASGSPPKEKRKYTKKAKADSQINTPEKGTKGSNKKRPRDDDSEDDIALSKRVKAQPPAKGKKQQQQKKAGSQGTLPSLKLTTKPSIQKIRLKPNTPGSTTTPRIRVKHQGLPPPRPVGVGYDSEAEDVEVDPAIESQFILRMMPGKDCDYLQAAIADKKMGIPKKDGGPDVSMRFFDREGRRGMVTIQGRHYAATLVDLPCIIESMKSWDKRGFYKSADICQMLLVHAEVPSEEIAKSIPLPREIDPTTSQYPHGLTPPMHWVRKRRFRKRVSYRTIEAVEDEVERLLAADEKAKKAGGNTEFTTIDLNRLRDDEEGSEDAEGEMDDSMMVDENGEPVGEAYIEGEDDEEMARLMEAELEGADDDGMDADADADAEAEAEADQPAATVSASTTEPSQSTTLNTSTTTATTAPPSQTATGAGTTPSSAALASTSTSSPAGTTPAANTPGLAAGGPSVSASATDDDDDASDADADADAAADDSSSDEDGEDDLDEDAQAAAAQKQAMREEADELKREMGKLQAQMHAQTNGLLRQRLQARIAGIRGDWELKMEALGEEVEE